MYVYLCTYVYVYVHVCVCVYVYIYIICMCNRTDSLLAATLAESPGKAFKNGLLLEDGMHARGVYF